MNLRIPWRGAAVSGDYIRKAVASIAWSINACHPSHTTVWTSLRPMTKGNHQATPVLPPSMGITAPVT
jgi:hypothetical protein